MAVPRRKNEKQNLIEVPTLITEEGLIDTKYFNVVGLKEELPTGKSSFLVGGSEFLKPNVKIKIEILDSEGNVIYTEPVRGYRENNLRRVSIEIYGDAVPGIATLTLLGEIDSTIEDIPQQWRGVYNVKYVRRFNINTRILNSEPIIFYKQPQVSVLAVTNAFKEYIPQPRETRILTGQIKNKVSKQGTSKKTTDPVTKEETFPKETEGDKAKPFLSFLNLPTFKLAPIFNFQFPLFSFSPPAGDSILHISSGSIDDGMIGESLSFAPASTNIDTTANTDLPSTYSIPTAYSSSVTNRLSDTRLELADVVFVSSSDGVDKYPVDTKEDTEFEVTFAPLPTEQDSVINYFDVADIRLSNMRTISGDVKYVNVYVLSKGAQSEQGFELIAQIPLEAEELIFDDSNIKNGRTGFFLNQEKINSYWHAYASKGTQLSGSGAPANNIKLEQTGSQIAYAMSISGSVEGENEDIVAQTSQSFDVTKSTPYSLSFKAYTKKLPKGGMSGDRGILECYISGSNIPQNHNLGTGLGRRVLTIDLDSEDYKAYNAPTTDFNLQTLEGVFTPLQSDTVKLQFRVKAGYWHLSDISLRPSTETNFNPRNARVFAEMPPSRNRPDNMRFLCEFVNNDGTKADAVTLSTEVEFPGANFAIQGDNNVLSGSMFISNAIGEGIEMAGVGSAFLRTIGWEGFVSASQGTGKGGFLLYSGSVLEDSTHEYEGAGLEIHDGQSGSAERYFQFKTQDGASSESIFRVKTDDFLFGISGSGGVEAYISGADGNLEISSSNFTISNTGNVTMAGNVTATTGKIGDWTISNGDIVGSNITMDADSSRIYKTDSNGELDGFYMDFTPGSNYYVRFGNDFAVSSSGQLIASGAIIEGVLTSSEGFIANWTIADNWISKQLTGHSNSDTSRIYLSTTSSAAQNIGQGLTIYRDNDDTNAGEVKIIRVGQLSDTTDLHVTESNDYGFQIITNKTANTYENLMYIGKHAQQISSFYINPVAIHSADKSLVLSGSGQITGSSVLFTGGTIGGFHISSTDFWGGNPTLGNSATKIVFGDIGDGETPKIALGATANSISLAGGTGLYVDGDGDFKVGSTSQYLKYTVSGNSMEVKTGTFELDANNIEISSTDVSMSLGEGKILLEGGTVSTIGVGSHATRKINISGSATAGIINTGKESVDDNTTGFWLANNNGNVEVNIGTSTNFLKLASGDFTLNVDSLDIDATDIEISSTQASASFGHDDGKGALVLQGDPARITIVSGSKSDAMPSAAGTSGSGQILRIGDITDNDGGTQFGLMMFDGSGTDVETDRILSLGDRGNVIAGWELTTNQIRAIPDAGVGENYAEGESKLVIHSAGRIETSDFATGLKGWRIDSAGNGTAEFENARIRGTLSTTVFEKESVNVVGGQLMVANSTTMAPLLDQSGSVLAGKASMSAADVTMSVANVSGFASGEIIKTKKVSDTGFSVEYMYITGSQKYTATGSPYSASIAAAISGGNFGAADPDEVAGELYVGRAYGAVIATSSSIGTVDTQIPTTGSYESEINIVLDLGSNAVVTQSILKINDERFKVISASGGAGTTGNNETIRVIRDYHNTDPAQHNAGTTVYKVDPDKEFLAGLISTAQTYNEGQVIVSTGKFDATKDLSSGYIMNNANPNDISTPYIDIIERTGSGVYDLSLRARLGDLSGLSSGYLYGEEEPGFGLYTDNGFFRGTIQAMTGSIHGILNIATTAGGIESGDKIMMGRNVAGSNDGMYINAHNYWYTTGAWKVGGATNYLSLDNASSGNIDIAAQTFRLYTSTLQISSSLASGTIRLGVSGGPSSAADTSNAGAYFDGTGKFTFVKDADEYIRYDGTALETRVKELNLVAGNMTLSGSSSSYIKIGTLSSVSDTTTTNKGFYVDNSGNVLLKGSTANTDYIQVGSGSAVRIKTSKFDLETTGLDILGTSGSGASNMIRLGATATNNDAFAGTSAGIYMDGDGNFRIGNASGTNYVKVSAGGSVLIGTDTFELSATDIDISSSGKTISLGEGNIYLDGGNDLIRVGAHASQNIKLVGAATTGSIYTGKTSFASTTAGFWLANSGGVSQFHVGDADEYLKFDGGKLQIKSGNIDITSTTFSLVANTNDLVIDSAGHYISLADGNITLDGTSTGFFEVGGLTSTAASQTAKGAYFEGDGDFIIKSNTTANENYIRGVGGDLIIKADDLEFTSTTFSLNAGSGKLILNSSQPKLELAHADARITLGATANTSVGGTNAGVYMDGGGDFLVYGDADNYLKFDISDKLDIRAEKFDLTTTTLAISSSVSNGMIALGAAGSTFPTASNSGGVGFYVDGDGKFFIGSGSNSNMLFDGTALSVNTTNFTLNSAGDVSMRGTVTADAGDIGGFSIAGGKLTAQEGSDTLIIQSAASGSQKIQLSDEDGALAVMRFDNLTVSSSLGGTQTFNTTGQATPASAIASSKNNVCSATSTDSAGYFNSKTASSLFEFGPGNNVGSNLTLIAKSAGDTTTADSGYIFKMVIEGSASASLWEAAHTENMGDLHSDHWWDAGGSGTVTYTLNVFNASTGVVIASAAQSKTYRVQDIEGNAGNQDGPWSGTSGQTDEARWYTKGHTITLEGNFQTGGSAPTLQYQLTQSVSNFDFDNAWTDETNSGTEQAYMSANTAITSFLVEPNSKVTEVTPKGIQTVHTITEGSEKYFIVDHSKTGSFTVGTDHSNDVWFISSAGNFRHRGNIYATADVYAYLSSDLRQKDNIELITNPIDKLKQVRGVSFTWNENKPIAREYHNPVELGVIAQEVKDVIPEVVREREDGYYAVKYEQLIPVLVEGIKEQQKQIDELNEKINSMVCGSVEPT